jgi:hypothetical protein
MRHNLEAFLDLLDIGVLDQEELSFVSFANNTDSQVSIQSAHFGDHVRIAHRMDPDAFDYNKGLTSIIRTTVETYTKALHIAFHSVQP